MYKFFPLFSLNLRVYVFLPNLCFCFTSILTMMHLCIMLYMYWTTLVFKQIRERPQPKSECAKSEESHSKIWDPQKRQSNEHSETLSRFLLWKCQSQVWKKEEGNVNGFGNHYHTVSLNWIHEFSVLYCIVLYLYIYIALLTVHTNQKRFQCERPREKRAVLCCA